MENERQCKIWKVQNTSVRKKNADGEKEKCIEEITEDEIEG